VGRKTSLMGRLAAAKRLKEMLGGVSKLGSFELKKVQTGAGGPDGSNI